MKKLMAIALVLSLVLSMGIMTASAEGKTTVVFWNSWTGGDGTTLQALVDKYNNSQDEVFIDMTRTTSFSDMLQTSLPTGEAADLILLGPDNLSQYEGYIRPIDDIFENTSLKREDFASSYLDLAVRDDVLYGIPFQISTYMLYYNKDLLEAAGIAEPPKTFAEWTEDAEKITALSTDETPIFGSGLFYCYNGQNQSAIQRFGTDYMIIGDEETGYKANLLGNQAFADAMIWMKNMYDKGYNPREREIDSMMKSGQIGIMDNGGWLKGDLDASGVNYGITAMPTVTGEDISSYALGSLSCFMLTTCASDEEAVAAEKFIEWWMTGEGLEAQEVTNGIDYSGITPNAEWSISMCYLNSYIPTINSPEYQADEILMALTPAEGAQVQMFAAPGTKFYADAARINGEYVEDWVFNGPEDPTYDDVQAFFEVYQQDLEDYIAEYYG